MANYYLVTAARDKVVKQFDPDVINAVYKASGRNMVDLVHSGTNNEDAYLYVEGEGWILDNLTYGELAALRIFSKSWRLQLAND